MLLLEKGPRPGRKLLLTGNGRCNVTNSLPAPQFVADCGRGARFLHNALGRFSTADATAFFASRGLPLQLEQGRLYFPRSGGAAAVLALLERELAAQGATVVTGAAVTAVGRTAAGFQVDAGRRYWSRELIIATGGTSYPGTGSSGEGYAMARALGHDVSEPRPGNVPLLVADAWLDGLQGVSLERAAISVACRGRRQAFAGGLMFTHYGISGPAALDASRALAGAAFPVAAELDLLPDLTPQRLDRGLVSAAARHGKRSLKGLVAQLLPDRLAAAVVSLAGGTGAAANQLSAGQRAAIVATIKHCPVTLSGTRGFDEAMVTVGGVDTRGLDPATMRSRLVPGLSFCGEVLDLDGPCGGYNLQIAWSTGFAAGAAAAESATGSER